MEADGLMCERAFLADDPSLAARVPPYLGGDEIARHPEQRPHRFVLDLNDLERRCGHEVARRNLGAWLCGQQCSLRIAMLDKPTCNGIATRTGQGRVHAAPTHLHPGVEQRVSQLALLGQPSRQDIRDDLLDGARNTLVAWPRTRRLGGHRTGNGVVQEAPAKPIHTGPVQAQQLARHDRLTACHGLRAQGPEHPSDTNLALGRAILTGHRRGLRCRNSAIGGQRVCASKNYGALTPRVLLGGNSPLERSNSDFNKRIKDLAFAFQ